MLKRVFTCKPLQMAVRIDISRVGDSKKLMKAGIVLNLSSFCSITRKTTTESVICQRTLSRRPTPFLNRHSNHFFHANSNDMNRKMISYSSGLNSDSSTAHQQLVAYCFTLDDESFDHQGSAKALQLRFGTEPAIFLHQEVFHMSFPRPAARQVETAGASDVFVFKDGSVVLWNTPIATEAALLTMLESFRTRRNGDDIEPERETMNCNVDATVTNVSAQPHLSAELSRPNRFPAPIRAVLLLQSCPAPNPASPSSLSPHLKDTATRALSRAVALRPL
jgi:hypothetical protein